MKKLLFALFAITSSAYAQDAPRVDFMSTEGSSVVGSIKHYITDHPDTVAKCIVVGGVTLSVYLSYKLVKKLYGCSKKSVVEKASQPIVQERIVYVDRVIEKTVEKPTTTQYHHVSVNHYVDHQVSVEPLVTYPTQSYTKLSGYYPESDYQCYGDVCTYNKPQQAQVVHHCPNSTTVYVENPDNTSTIYTAALLNTMLESDRRDADRKQELADIKRKAEEAQRQAARIAQQQAEVLKSQQKAEQELALIKKQEKLRKLEEERLKLETERRNREAAEAAQRKQEQADASQDAEEDAADRGSFSFFL